MSLVRDRKKYDRIKEKQTDGFETMTQRQYSKLSADLNFLAMDMKKDEERLAIHLGYLKPEDATPEFRPSGFHTYKGVAGEFKK